MGMLALSAASYLLYSYSGSGMRGAALHQAAFDIVGIAYRNATFGACLLGWNTTCMRAYTARFAEAYSLRYISVRSNSQSADYGNQGSCTDSIEYCLPMRDNVSYREYCFTICGG